MRRHTETGIRRPAAPARGSAIRRHATRRRGAARSLPSRGRTGPDMKGQQTACHRDGAVVRAGPDHGGAACGARAGRPVRGRDWDALRFFLALCEAGTLSGAARTPCSTWRAVRAKERASYASRRRRPWRPSCARRRHRVPLTRAPGISRLRARSGGRDHCDVRKRVGKAAAFPHV